MGWLATASAVLLSGFACCLLSVAPTLGLFVWVSPPLAAMRWLLHLDAEMRRREQRRVVRLAVLLALALVAPVALWLDVRWPAASAIVGVQLATLYPLVALDTSLEAWEGRATRGRRVVLRVVRLAAVLAWLPLTMLSIATHRVPAVMSCAAGDAQRIEFPGARAIRLVGLWFPHPRPSGAVLLVHGLGAEKVQFLGACAALRQLGYEVLTYDQRNHGESAGLTCTLGSIEAADCVGAWRELRRRATRGPFLLYGVSLGGAAAQLAAPQLDGLDGLVLDSTFADLRRVAAARIPVVGAAAVGLLRALHLDVALTGVRVLDVVPVASIRATDAFAVLVLHARRDPVVPFAEAEALARAYGTRARLVGFNLSVHAQAFLTAPAVHERALTEFDALLRR